jgi:hypothetical protein
MVEIDGRKVYSNLHGVKQWHRGGHRCTITYHLVYIMNDLERKRYNNGRKK